MAGLNLFEIVESLHLLNHKSKSGIFVFFGVPASSVANSWIAIAKKVIISKFLGKSTWFVRYYEIGLIFSYT